MTDINEIKRELEALTAKVAAYEAEKATKRSWPERIEAGMCFRWGKGLTYIYVQGGTLANIESGETFDAHLGFNGRERDFTYLGHARDILTIRTDAHEPTGAELVGKVCEFSDDGVNWIASGECGTYDRNDENCTYRTKDFEVRSSEGCNRSWFRFARLTKERDHYRGELAAAESQNRLEG